MGKAKRGKGMAASASSDDADILRAQAYGLIAHLLARPPSRDLLGTVAATFALTIANPMTIVSFAAIFAGLGLGSETGGASAFIIVAGVFLGSLGWWAVLSGGVALARQRLPEGFATWISRLSGVVLIGFGVMAIGSLLIAG